MHREEINLKEAICLVMFFVIGSTVLLGVASDARNNAWAAVVVSIIAVMPVILIYSRILSIFPGKDIFEILGFLFGKVAGKSVAVLFTWYSFHLGGLVLRNFGEYVKTVALPETPLIFMLLCMGLVAIVAVKMGIEVIGRFSAYFVPVFIFIAVIIQVFLIPQFQPKYLKPILKGEIPQIMDSAFSAFSFPFAEVVLFTGVLFAIKNKKDIKKAYLSGTIFAGLFICVITVNNIMTLGPMLNNLYFPSHISVSRIRIGDFIERIEISVSIVFVVTSFIKTCVCLLVTCRGMAYIFNLKEYRSVVLQTGLLMVYFSDILYGNTMEMRKWAFSTYRYYAIPFQLILPFIIWIFAEIKQKKGNKKIT